MLAYLDRGDGTSEALAGRLRSGNAGVNNAADHVAVFAEARGQLPALPGGPPCRGACARLVRADSAGASHVFLRHVRAAGWEFSVGFPLTGEVKTAIRQIPDAAWTEALTQHGEVRDRAELTDAVDLNGCPAGSRLIVRCEPLHPGAQ